MKKKYMFINYFFLKSPKCYEFWKVGFLCSLKNLIDNFSHIQIDEATTNADESLAKHVEKLSAIPGSYEKLVKVIFRNLKANNGFKITSNSKRLLKEFQLRYCFVILI